MRKYFFSYHLVNGIPFSLMWAEEDGICVGGRPQHLVGGVREVSEKIFKTGELNPLMKLFPYINPKEDISITPSTNPGEV